MRRASPPEDDDVARACRPLPRERHAGVVDLRLDAEHVRRPTVRALSARFGGRNVARVDVPRVDVPFDRVAGRVFDVRAACVLTLEGRSFGASAGNPNVTLPGPAFFPPSNVPEIAPATKTSTASTSMRRQRGRGPTGAGSTATGVGSAGAAGAGGLGRSRTSGSSLRACSASTGSTSASSGLIGPRSDGVRSGPLSIRTVLQARRRTANQWRRTEKPAVCKQFHHQSAPSKRIVRLGAVKDRATPRQPEAQLADGTRVRSQTDPVPGAS
jgi:hypothetical protein